MYEIFYFPNCKLNPPPKKAIGENNYIKYGKGSKAIKSMFTFLSIKFKGQSLWTDSLCERKLVVEHIKKCFTWIKIGMYTKAAMKCYFITVKIKKLQR